MSLSVKQTQIAIKFIKDNFEDVLAKKLNLTRVSAPLFVERLSGLNDGLNGIDQPVSFNAPFFDDCLQIVQSLAKWKRLALKKYEFSMHEGLYTDMNAIRKDELLDETHSIYVDQWDWEVIIDEKERNLAILKSYVKKVASSIFWISYRLARLFPNETYLVNKEVTFIHANDLLKRYPNESPKERERLFAKKHGVIFIIGIGGKLDNGMRHDARAPDYDDWNLNGDLLYYFEPLDMALEISSMGIRVDRNSLLYQLSIAGKKDDATLPYHQDVIKGNLPFTIGGGIGQSRLCQMLLLKRHIGEVQASVWTKAEIERNAKKGITFL